MGPQKGPPQKTSGVAAAPTGPASVIARLAGHPGGVLAVAFSPDRGFLASGGRDGAAKLWDIGSGSPSEKGALGPPGRRLQSLAFSATGKTVAAGSGALDGTVWLFDVAGMAPRETLALRGARGAVNALAFSPDGNLIAGTGEDRVVRVWETTAMSRGDPRAQLTGHTGPVRALAFSPDGQTVATGSDDSSVRLWTVSRIRSLERAALPHPSGVTAVVFTPDGHTLITGGRDGVIRLLDAGSGKPGPRGELPAQSSGIRLLVVTKDGKTLVSVADGPRAVHWDLAAGRPVREWALPANSSSPVAVTRDGRYLAMGKAEGALEVFRIAEKRG
jgi:WD40 repeat protein